MLNIFGETITSVLDWKPIILCEKYFHSTDGGGGRVTKISLCITYANKLYKGHGKEKTLVSSYRTISMCPLIARCLHNRTLFS